MRDSRKAGPRARAVLVVDDAPTVRRFLAVLLAEAGLHVREATSAEEATTLIASERFDLVIADKNLPGADGFAVCHALRQADPHAACMLMTGDRSVSGAARAVEEEVAAYLLKPLRRDPVLTKVSETLERVRLVREREQAREALERTNADLARRTAELERALEQLVTAQRQLSESEKQASVGLLAAGLAHEINNPACFIQPNLDYLRRATIELAQLAQQAGAPAAAVDQQRRHSERMIDRCQEGVDRIVEVVRTLQLFSRRDDQAVSEIDVDRLCRALLGLVAHELDGKATLEVELQAPRPIRGNHHQLAHAVLELLLNARRSVFSGPAPPQGHRIRLTTAQSGDRLVLTVEDSGPLLAAPEQQDRALDPFFGSGDLTAGPGLRLALARDIIHRHGGELTLDLANGSNRLRAVLGGVAPAAS